MICKGLVCFAGLFILLIYTHVLEAVIPVALAYQAAFFTTVRPFVCKRCDSVIYTKKIHIWSSLPVLAQSSENP